MTRTSRASFPRAANRDRSESKTGLDKSLRKNGAGSHNWGSTRNERELEDAALYDDDIESWESSPSDAQSDTSGEKLSNSFTLEDKETAKKFRKNALKSDGLDLSAIARTSSGVVLA